MKLTDRGGTGEPDSRAHRREFDGAVGVSVDVIVTGRMPIPHAYAFRSESGSTILRLASMFTPGGEFLRSPLLAFAIRHPRAGTILVDTGLHPDAGEDLRRDFGLPMSILFRNLRPAKQPFDAQLRELDIDPSAVGRVLMTHLHVDHTSGMRLLPNAEFFCSAREWSAASGGQAAGRGYVSHHLPARSRARLIDFEADGKPFGPFAETVDLLGDGSIRLISTPGHTPGHLSVLVRLAGGSPALLVGDAAYTLRSIREQILPAFTAGEEAYRRSLAELKQFADRKPEALLVPSHDPAAWEALQDLAASDQRLA